MDANEEKVWEELQSLIKHEEVYSSSSGNSSGEISHIVIDDLVAIIGSELSRGNLLRQFRLQPPQHSETNLIQLQFLKLAEPIKGILVRPQDKVVVIECQGSSEPRVRKFSSDLLSQLEIPRDYMVQSGYRIIFSYDVEPALTYILKSQTQAANTFVYVDTNDFQVVQIRTLEFLRDNWKLEEMALSWSDLNHPCRLKLLEKFRTQNECSIAYARSNNIVNGELLLTLLHTNNTMEELLKNRNIFIKAKDLLDIFPITRHVKHRNYFVYEMLADPVLQGSKMKLISSTTNESGSSEETCQLLSHNSSSSISAEPLNESDGITHTFKLVKDGTVEYDFSSPSTGSWLVTEPPTLQWLSTQPPEKFCDLQIILMKRGVHSELELVDNIIMFTPSDTSRRHCILSGESGTGKTTMLKCFAKSFIDHYLKFANQSVVALVSFADIIKFLGPDLQLDKTTVAKAILASIREATSLSDYDWSNLYQILTTGRGATTETTSCPVFLFLDGMDQVGFENLEKSFDVVRLLHSEFQHVSICVTTRPHLVLRLEAILMTFAYNLEMLENPVELAEYIDCDSSFKIVPCLGKLGDYRSNKLFRTPQGLMMLHVIGERPGVPDEHLKDPEYLPLDNMLDFIKLFIAFWREKHGRDFQDKILLAALRYYAVTRLCPSFSFAPQFSKVVLEGITKEELEQLGLHPFPSSGTCMDCGIITEYVIAEMLADLMREWYKKDSFDLLTTFLETYYLLNVDRINVYEVDSVYKNCELQDKLHFANVFEILNEMFINLSSGLCGSYNSLPFEMKLEDILLVAIFYDHSRIFSFFSATEWYKHCLKDYWKFIYFQVSTGHFHPFHQTIPRSCHDRQIQGLINLLNRQSAHKRGTFWGANSVYAIFNNGTPPYVECITQMLKGLMEETPEEFVHKICSEEGDDLKRESLPPTLPHSSFVPGRTSLTKFEPYDRDSSGLLGWERSETPRSSRSTRDFKRSSNSKAEKVSRLHANQTVSDPQKDHVSRSKSHHAKTIFGLIVSSENISLTSSVIEFLKFLLKINPEAANDIFHRGDYLTILGMLLQVKVNPLNFSHKDPIFQDIYRLITSFPDKLSSIIKENILETVKGGLKAYNLEKKSKQVKTWYTDIYRELLDKVYQIWLEQHEDWWEKQETTLSKQSFLRACASVAFENKFRERKSLFRLQAPYEFVDELADIGLLDECGGLYFFHDAISDYLIAWATANVGFAVDYKDFKKFMITTVMAFKRDFKEEPGEIPKFQHSYICYFLDELLDDVHCRVDVILQRGTEECRKGFYSSPPRVIPELENILQTCYHLKHYNLLNLFAKECYEDIFSDEVIEKLLFEILENISRPLAKLTIVLLKSAAKKGLLETVTNKEGERICDVARRSCVGKPFENQIMNCFAHY